MIKHVFLLSSKNFQSKWNKATRIDRTMSFFSNILNFLWVTFLRFFLQQFQHSNNEIVENQFFWPLQFFRSYGIRWWSVQAAMVELTVDNFLTEKIFNDFKAQMTKSLEMRLFICFWEGIALFGYVSRESAIFLDKFLAEFSPIISSVKIGDPEKVTFS